MPLTVWPRGSATFAVNSAGGRSAVELSNDRERSVVADQVERDRHGTTRAGRSRAATRGRAASVATEAVARCARQHLRLALGVAAAGASNARMQTPLCAMGCISNADLSACLDGKLALDHANGDSVHAPHLGREGAVEQCRRPVALILCPNVELELQSGAQRNERVRP